LYFFLKLKLKLPHLGPLPNSKRYFNRNNLATRIYHRKTLRIRRQRNNPQLLNLSKRPAKTQDNHLNQSLRKIRRLLPL
jgi:hypothetical protein